MLQRGSVLWKVWVSIGAVLLVAFAISVIAWRPAGLRILGAILLVLLAGVGWGWFNLRKEAGP
jgi:hypothetical protein